MKKRGELFVLSRVIAALHLLIFTTSELCGLADVYFCLLPKDVPPVSSSSHHDTNNNGAVSDTKKTAAQKKKNEKSVNGKDKSTATPENGDVGFTSVVYTPISVPFLLFWKTFAWFAKKSVIAKGMNKRVDVGAATGVGCLLLVFMNVASLAILNAIIFFPQPQFISHIGGIFFEGIALTSMTRYCFSFQYNHLSTFKHTYPIILITLPYFKFEKNRQCLTELILLVGSSILDGCFKSTIGFQSDLFVL